MKITKDSCRESVSCEYGLGSFECANWDGAGSDRRELREARATLVHLCDQRLQRALQVARRSGMRR